MNRRLIAVAGVVAVLFGGGYALTQTRLTPLQKTDAPAAADAPVRDTVKAYVAAFNKGDFDAVVGYWADDAELIDEDGVTVRGRQAIGESLKPCCKPGGVNTMAAQVKSVKVVGGTVALVDGTVDLTTEDGTETSAFEGVMVYDAAGKAWRFSRMRDLPGVGTPEYAPAYAHLKGLDWLVGRWAGADGDQALTLNARWMKNRAYLIVDQTVRVKENELLGLTMMIGYDPDADQLTSWVFDTNGGRGEASWTREGNTWTLDAAGRTADGQEVSSSPEWKFIDGNTFEWSSLARQLDGQPRPDLHITFRKVEPATQPAAEKLP